MSASEVDSIVRVMWGAVFIGCFAGSLVGCVVAPVAVRWWTGRSNRGFYRLARIAARRRERQQ